MALAPGWLRLRVPRIKYQRQQPEQAAQHVFALGNPRHGFHTQWMKCK